MNSSPDLASRDTSTPFASQATAFSRATAFNTQFLNANQDLPTATVARRSADFFLFENASAQQASDIHDMTVQSFPVTNVSALGAQGATDMPVDAAPVQPPAISAAAAPPMLVNPAQLVRNDVELQSIQARTIEVAIYRVYFDDANQNGQADENELPSEQDILAAEVVDAEEDANESAEIEPSQRLKLGKVKTESGGSPTVEDIEELKNEFLNDPQRPSGAYAIIERGLDNNETVLDVFSVRDVDQTASDAEQPLIQLPSHVDATNSTESSTSEQNTENADIPAEAIDRPSADDSSNYRATTEAEFLDVDQGHRNAQSESRLAHAGLIAASLWFVRHHSKSQSSETAAAHPALASSERVGFGRRARRHRRIQRQGIALRSIDGQDRSTHSSQPASHTSTHTVPTSNGDSL